MTISKATKEAIKKFDETMKGAEIRSISILEWQGEGAKVKNASFHIVFARGNDYTESDKNPLYIKVIDDNGVILTGCARYND